MIKVAVLWLVNEKGELLLALRSEHKKQDPGVWGPSVTGKLEPDETAHDALLRETQEELSLPPDKYEPKYLMEAPFEHPDGEQRIFTIYTARVASTITDAMVIDDNEVVAIEWRSIQIINKMLALTPEKLVPSASSVWPATFRALQPK